MALTTDPTDPRLGHGSDDKPGPQNPVYLVLPETERHDGFIRPIRNSYRHTVCGTVTRMANEIAETYAKKPYYYGFTYCSNCMKHLPVDEFVWTDDDTVVGS